MIDAGYFHKRIVARPWAVDAPQVRLTGRNGGSTTSLVGSILSPTQRGLSHDPTRLLTGSLRTEWLGIFIAAATASISKFLRMFVRYRYQSISSLAGLTPCASPTR